MRKLLTGGLTAAVMLALGGGAVVQAQTDGVEFTAKATPSDAGTKRKPKNTSLRFNMKVDRPGTTTEFIDLALPAGLKFNGRGLGDCTAEKLEFEGPDACANDAAGPPGTATALLGAANAPLNFTVQAFVENASSLVFYVASSAGDGVSVQSPITGKITDAGRKLRITIPLALRQPVPGVDASLTGLNQLFTARKGKRYLVSSTGCRRGKHRFGATLTFSVRADLTPVPEPASATTNASCRK